MRYLRLFEVFNQSGKCPLWDASSQGNICWAFAWLGKCPSGMCLVEEMSVGHLSGQGNVRRDVSDRGNVHRESVHRGTVHRGCVWELSHYPAKFGGYKRCSSGDIMALVCHVI